MGDFKLCHIIPPFAECFARPLWILFTAWKTPNEFGGVHPADIGGHLYFGIALPFVEWEKSNRAERHNHACVASFGELHQVDQ